MIPKFRSWVENVRHPKYSFMQYEPEFNGEINKIFEKNGEIQHGVKVSYMQSTGLKDKNGVEIFEEDVVKMDRPPVNEKSLFLVKDYVLGKVIFAEVNEFGKDSWSFNGGYTGYSLEVIGNIYTNPELLEAI
ncbi:YopX family protein [Enterococcus dongliensis]|uniref:YopX family protein n=1 Tax=Enterococcus dongliensis TaxID=2559925 RepID=UPI00288D3B3D|nr:YopX family protein [Enterococcus dongliensis]MDT2677306.1 YopX family protein [Enterococcus dongliensis]